MRRRHVLAVPLLAAVGWSGAAVAAPGRGGAWALDVSEVRIGGGGAALVRSAGAGLGVAVRGCALRGEALVVALDRGHLEAAVLDGAELRRATQVMGERLVVGPGGVVVRRALPDGMRAALAAALGRGDVG